MSQVQDGDSVKIHYTGKLTDGEQFDTSQGGDPLAFTIGSGMVIPGFDTAVMGMRIGDKKTVTIPAAEAYGEIQEGNVVPFGKDQLPEGMEVSVGDQLQMESPEGQPIPVKVVAVDETTITLDANHELAGKDLVFDLELVSID